MAEENQFDPARLERIERRLRVWSVPFETGSAETRFV